MPRLTVVIPARDAAGTVRAALGGLERQVSAPPFEVVLVDDGSSDGTGELARSAPIVDRVIRLTGVGPAQARNAGAAEARADRLAFLDADCVPTPRWLAGGDAALDQADLVIGETRPRPDRPIGPFDRTLSVVGRSPLFESANLFVRRDLFERLGGFESWLRPRDGIELGEDVWFGWSAVRAGARIAACPEALAHHEVFARGPVGFATERWRLRFFPAMAQRIPELREAFLYRRYFLNYRSACFDAALAGIAVASATRRLSPAAAALPYAHLISRDLREPQGAYRSLVRITADAVSLAALLVGSVSSRTLLI